MFIDSSHMAEESDCWMELIYNFNAVFSNSVAKYFNHFKVSLGRVHQ